MQMSYWRFAAMIATSTLCIFFLVYLIIYTLEHVIWSDNRAWTSILKGPSKAYIMLAFMVSVYKNKVLKI